MRWVWRFLLRRIPGFAVCTWSGLYVIHDLQRWCIMYLSLAVILAYLLQIRCTSSARELLPGVLLPWYQRMVCARFQHKLMHSCLPRNLKIFLKFLGAILFVLASPWFYLARLYQKQISHHEEPFWLGVVWLSSALWFHRPLQLLVASHEIFWIRIVRLEKCCYLPRIAALYHSKVVPIFSPVLLVEKLVAIRWLIQHSSSSG